MTTQDLIERIKRYPLALGVGVTVLACFLAYYFRMDLVSDLQARHDDVAVRLMQIEDNLVAGTNLEAHLREVKSQSDALGERLVKQSELAVNLKYFYQLESETGAALADLRQNSLQSKNPDPKTVVCGVGYSLIVTGTFHQVVAYFDELENGSRLYRLNGFNLQRGRETARSTVTLALNLDLLGWP